MFSVYSAARHGVIASEVQVIAARIREVLEDQSREVYSLPLEASELHRSLRAVAEVARRIGGPQALIVVHGGSQEVNFKAMKELVDHLPPNVRLWFVVATSGEVANDLRASLINLKTINVSYAIVYPDDPASMAMLPSSLTTG